VDRHQFLIRSYLAFVGNGLNTLNISANKIVHAV